MKLHQDKRKELELAFRHVTRVKDAMTQSSCEPTIRSAVCYIVNQSDANLVHDYWKEKCVDCSLNLYLVGQLPRAANFEWEIVFSLNSL